MGNLTFEKAAVVRMYRNGSRGDAIAAMRETRAYLEPEMREMVDSAIRKLAAMTDREFAAGNVCRIFRPVPVSSSALCSMRAEVDTGLFSVTSQH